MKLKTQQYFYFSIGLFFLLSISSCVIYRSGNVAGGSVPARYDRYVSVVRGDAKSISVFGLGGMRRDALVQEARAAMMRSRPLFDKEYYNNYNFTFSKKYILMVGIDKATVCADVMLHSDSVTENLFSDEYRRLSNLPSVKNKYYHQKDTFEIGELVYATESLEKYRKALYSIAYFDTDYLYLRPVNKLDKLKRKQREVITVFHQSKKQGGLCAGDSVYVQDLLFATKYEKGLVLGLNNNEVLVQKARGYEMCIYARVNKIKN